MKHVVETWWPKYESKDEEITRSDILDAIDSVTWYNGLSDFVMAWKDIPINQHGSISPIYTDQAGDDFRLEAQLQVIWMILVVLFGDYGTSPRYGWIDKRNMESFHEFIDQIIKTAREDKETENNIYTP